LRDSFSCTPLCRIVVSLQPLAATIGPAGDVLHVPFRIAGGVVLGIGNPKAVLAGTDFLSVYADEQIVHNGNLVIAAPEGDVLLWYDGPSRAQEGSYDAILEGRFAGKSPCRLSVRTVSMNPEWRSLNRRPILGVGTFDGVVGTLEFTLLTVTDNDALN
jgi:hypothetical protein